MTYVALTGRHMVPQGHRMASVLVWKVSGLGVFKAGKHTLSF